MQTDGLNVKDVEIIRLLKENARLTFSEIGDQVGLSRTAVINRMVALEREGVIRGYHADIDPLAAPGLMPFVINVETKPEHFDEAKAYFQQAEETKTLMQTSGRCHLLAICVATDVPSMRNRLNEIYRKVPGILSINAHSILDMIKGGIISD